MFSKGSALARYGIPFLLLGGLVACGASSASDEDSKGTSKAKRRGATTDDDDEKGAETKAKSSKEVDPELLGAGCGGGVGGSQGRISAFEMESCEGGLCIFDGTFTSNTYCSADCSNAACPVDWMCTETEGALKKSACTKDPTGPWNPLGYHYPVEHLGWSARDAGPGDVLENLKLEGLAPGTSVSAPLQLASLYDPSRRNFDAIVIYGMAAWDRVGANVLAQLESAKLTRIAFVVALGYGSTPGVPAVAADLAEFRAKNPIAKDMWVVLDPGFGISGAAFKDATRLPHRVVLDARSMEIVESITGIDASPSQGQQIANVRAQILANPPAYEPR